MKKERKPVPKETAWNTRFTYRKPSSIFYSAVPRVPQRWPMNNVGCGHLMKIKTIFLKRKSLWCLYWNKTHTSLYFHLLKHCTEREPKHSEVRKQVVQSPSVYSDCSRNNGVLGMSTVGQPGKGVLSSIFWTWGIPSTEEARIYSPPLDAKGKESASGNSLPILSSRWALMKSVLPLKYAFFFLPHEISLHSSEQNLVQWVPGRLILYIF